RALSKGACSEIVAARALSRGVVTLDDASRSTPRLDFAAWIASPSPPSWATAEAESDADSAGTGSDGRLSSTSELKPATWAAADSAPSLSDRAVKSIESDIGGSAISGPSAPPRALICCLQRQSIAPSPLTGRHW